MHNLRIFDDSDTLSAGLAHDIVSALEDKLRAGQSLLHVAISGGRTPLGLLDCLVKHHSDSRIWKHVQLYWVDERYVPFDHPESNYGNARPFIEALGIPLDQIHPMGQGSDPHQAAAEYGKHISEIAHLRGTQEALFDLTLLGLGPDGHVASLFPGTDHTQDLGFCKATIRPETGQHRITLTLLALNRSDFCIFMASGASKREIVTQVYKAKPDTYLPATLIQPINGPVWYVDEAAKPENQ